jgi:hypothetical protein
LEKLDWLNDGGSSSLVGHCSTCRMLE